MLGLGSNLFPGLLWRFGSPHGIKGVHIKGQVIETALVVGQGSVDKGMKVYKLVDIVPNLLVGGMENMGSILMNLNPFHFLTVNIASHMMALVNNLDLFPPLIGLMGKDRP